MLQVTTICANVARRGSSPNPNPSLPLSQMYNQTTLFDASNYVNNVLIQEGPLEKDFTKHVFLKNIWMWTCSTNLVARQGRAGAFFVPIGVEANHAGLRKFRHMMNESLVLAFMF